MGQSKNTYAGGLDKDLSKIKYPNSKYFNAKNLKVITEGSLSTGALETEKGTKLSFTIPDTQSIYRVSRVNTDFDPATTANSITLTYAVPAGTQTVTFNYPISSFASPKYNKDIFDKLLSNTAIQTQITNGLFNIFLADSDEWVYFVGLDSSLVVTVAGPDLIIEQIVTPQLGLKLLAGGLLRDKLILFTTNEDSETPTGSAGQIWVLNYDEYTDKVIDIGPNDTLVPSKHLIYNNILNFSTYFRFDEPVGRYESENTQRIYWTDFNEEVRTINIVGDNLFTVEPGNLNLVANVALTLPTIESIGVGNLKVGSVVQYGYRLLSASGGKETVVSPLSKPIVLTQSNSQGQSTTPYNGSLQGYSGISGALVFRGDSSAGTTAARSVTWLVEEIDPDFDIIEHFAVYWSIVDAPVITKFNEGLVPTDGSLTITYDGNELETVVFTEDEFNYINPGFYCKTLTYKFERLLAGNIKEKIVDIDYDARAYRSQINTCEFKIETSDGLLEEFDSIGPNAWNVPEKHDAINPYNQTDPAINENWYTDDQYKYQPCTDILGGAGPNISYKFITHETIGNSKFGSEYWSWGPWETAPYGPQTPTGYEGTEPLSTLQRNTYVETFTAGIGTTVTLGEERLDNTQITYPIGEAEQWNGMSSPMIQSLFTGYARGEVYRFGIAFRDLKGNPSFVNWIGDIKFPEAYDEGFELSQGKDFGGGYGIVENRQLGIEFTVDISSIKNIISGFEIVRVKRRSNDKTRIGTGIVTTWEDWGGLLGLDNGQMWTKWQGMTAGLRTRRDISIAGQLIANASWITPRPVPGFGHLTGDLAIDEGEPSLNATRSFVTLHSGLKLFDSSYQLKENDHIKTIGYYAGLPMTSDSVAVGGSAFPYNPPYNILRHSGYWLAKHFIKINSPWLEAQCTDGVAFTHDGPTKFFPLTGCLKIDQETNFDNSEFQVMKSGNPFFNGSIFKDGSPIFNFVQSAIGAGAKDLLPEYAGNVGPHGRFRWGDGSGSDKTDGRYDMITFGAKKHCLMLAPTANAAGLDWYWGATDMKYFGFDKHVPWADPLQPAITGSYNSRAFQIARINDGDHSSAPGQVTQCGGTDGSYWNYFKVVSYDRFLANQYGGADYVNRQKSLYQSTGHFQAIGTKSTTTKTFQVFGGDVYVNYFDDEYLPPAINGSNASLATYQLTNTVFPEVGSSGAANGVMGEDGASGIAIAFPCEIPTNTELRTSYHWASDRWTTSFTTLETMGCQIIGLIGVYMQQNNARTVYIAKDALTNFVEEHSHRIRVSEKKNDGELKDSWAIFLEANQTEVEGVHGPIQDMINFKGEVIFFQDSGIGSVPIDDRAVVTSSQGSELVLGTGTVIDTYSYITNTSGTIHQHSVVNTGNSLIYWDDRNKKMYSLGGSSGVSPISDIKGLSSYFPTLDGYANTGDKTLTRLTPGSYGVHGVFDIRNQRVLMTFLNANKILEIEDDTKYYPGDIITFGYPVSYYYEASEIIITGNPATDPDVDSRWTWLVDKDGKNKFQNAVTISFNEYIQAFESFLDYHPRIYINAERRLLSESRLDSQEIYEHNIGDYARFYGEVFKSSLTIILNPGADITSVFNNLEVNSEVSINNVDQATSTITEMELWNDYQNTGAIPLVVNDTIKRRMRRWRITLPRDQQGARLRNPYVFLRVEFKNETNKRLILHDIILHSIQTNS